MDKAHTKNDLLRYLHQHVQAEKHKKEYLEKQEQRLRLLTFIETDKYLHCYGHDAHLLSGLLEEDVTLLPYQLHEDNETSFLALYEVHPIMKEFTVQLLNSYKISSMTIVYDTDAYDRVEEMLNERGEEFFI